MARGLSCPAACGAVIEPVTLSLAGGFLTTGPPGVQGARIAHLVVEAVGTPLEHGRECPIALLNWEPDCLIFNSLKTTVQLCQLW